MLTQIYVIIWPRYRAVYNKWTESCLQCQPLFFTVTMLFQSFPIKWGERTPGFLSPQHSSTFSNMEANQQAMQLMSMMGYSSSSSSGEGKQRTLYSTLLQCDQCCHVVSKYRKWFPPNYQQMQQVFRGSTLRMRLLRLRKRQIENETCDDCAQKLRIRASYNTHANVSNNEFEIGDPGLGMPSGGQMVTGTMSTYSGPYNG